MTSLLSDMFEALSEGIAIYDAEARLVAFNRRYTEMLEPVADLVVPGVSWRVLNLECVRRGVYAEVEGTEAEVIAKAEADLDARKRGVVVHHADGSSYEISYTSTSGGGFVITRADVTERLKAEARLREREALLTTVFDTNPTPVVMARLKDSRIVYRSPAAYEFFGNNEYAMDYYDKPEDRAEYVAELKKNGRVRDRKFDTVSQDGSSHAVSISGGLTEYDGEICVVSSITDLTEQMEQEALIRLVVEACPAPILMIRADTGEILFRSPQAIELFGDRESAR